MLVSSIAKFSALNNMNNAAFGAMQTAGAMQNIATNNSFGGEHDLAMLNKMDKKMSLDLNSNKMLYQINYLQEKMSAKHEELNSCKKPHFTALA